MPVRVLSLHAGYGCRHSGACCRSGWDIPAEPEIEERLDAALAAGRIDVRPPWSQPRPGLPHGARVVLRVTGEAACVFHQPGRPGPCAVHRALGPDALPSACRQFPRVATLSPLGVSVTLSHYCPTAAGLLFRDEAALGIVTDPPAFPPAWPYEGLDAREALPPFLRPGVLMSWPAHARLERHAVATLARSELTPEAALETLATTAERLRVWTPRDGPFDDFVERVIEAGSRDPLPAASASSLEAALADWESVAAAVPPGQPQPSSPRTGLEAFGIAHALASVDAGWAVLRAPVRRWLAARAFASWLPLQGGGARTTALGLRVSLGVLRAEAVRACMAGGDGPLDAATLKEALRRSDLLLHHLVDVEALATRLSRCETAW